MREGYLTPELARQSYGVALCEGQVDEAATAELRAGMVEERGRDA